MSSLESFLGGRTTYEFSRYFNYCNARLKEQVDIHGAEAIYPTGGLGAQWFFKTLGDGVVIEVCNMDHQRSFRWGMMENVVEGLWFFLVEGGRYRQCFFEFREGPGNSIGGGQIVRDKEEPDEAAES